LTRGLLALAPDSAVVGEEAVAADPSLLAALKTESMLWLVDPLDGTRNFDNGSSDVAVMVALVQGGETVASWIHRPADGRVYTAVRGAGAFANGERLQVRAVGRVSDLRGAVLTRFLTERQGAAVERFAPTIGSLTPGRLCAGVDYPLIAERHQDFVLFRRTLPWDHAPGALLVTEAGGHVAHLDGSDYRPTVPREGLIAAANPEAHQAVAHALLAAGRP
jgi:fructose-1,6-bisphosphatase/inositol monophosphatase family enzyme